MKVRSFASGDAGYIRGSPYAPGCGRCRPRITVQRNSAGSRVYPVVISEFATIGPEPQRAYTSCLMIAQTFLASLRANGIRMGMVRVAAVLACLFLLLEVGLGIWALRSKAKALQMLQTMDRFELGATSRTEVKSELRQLGLIPIDEACSSVAGPCDGIGVVLANCPVSSQSSITRVLDIFIARISIFRPTYLVANFYFHSDRLSVAEVQFSTDKVSIGTMLASTELGEDATTEWRQNNRTWKETFVRVLDSAHQQGASLSSADDFDLGCMESLWGCNTASELWPSMPQYRANH